jgi:hypothetical protein
VLDHVVARLNPQPGEKCLDVATSTGWTARLLRAREADVTGVDIGAVIIDAAKKLAQNRLPHRRCGGTRATDDRAFTGQTCQAEAIPPDVLAEIVRDAVAVGYAPLLAKGIGFGRHPFCC